MELTQLIAQVTAAGLVDRLANNPAAQFGIAPERFLGATILPEQTVDGNMVKEEGMRYRAVIANDAARYSPVQLKEGAARFGSMTAEMAESDIGKEFTGQQYDQVRKLLGRGGTMEAQGRFLGWLDAEVNQALLRLNERQRWNALIDAAVIRVGDNGYTETVTYTNPTGHRRQIAADWEAVSAGASTNDPFTDIFGIYQDAQNKNLQISRIVMSTKTQFKMLRNTKVQDRARYGAQGFIPPNASILRGPMAVPQLAALFQSQGLPSPEIFDQTYEDSTGTKKYLHEDKILFVCSTGRTQEIVPTTGSTFYVEDTLGYHAIGTPQGEDDPGRVITNRVFNDDKPYRIESKGWQTALPVILSPEHVFVLTTTV